MGARTGRTRMQRRFASLLAGITIGLAGCTAQATPVPEALPSPTPIFCDDGSNAFTPMPEDCVIPNQPVRPSILVEPKPAITAVATFPAGLRTLPPAISGHVRTIYAPASGMGAQLIGLGPDDTIYILVEQPVPFAKPTAAYLSPDVRASVVALRPDGSPKAGWPKAGVPVEGYPYSYHVNGEGTVFVAGGANPSTDEAKSVPTSLTITAIGSDGKVLPGWPYRTPAAVQAYEDDLLTGPNGMVCFVNLKPGALPYRYVRELAYCLGRDGILMPGWPYSGNGYLLLSPVIGPDGTLYVAQTTSDEISKPYPYGRPYQVIAIGPDGKPMRGWTPWVRSDDELPTWILPTADGRIQIVLGGDAGLARVVRLDATGKLLDDHVELPSMLSSPIYDDAVLTGDGSVFVAAAAQNGNAGEHLFNGHSNVLNAYSPDGTQMTGWPQRIGPSPSVDVAVGSHGAVWVAWTVYGPDNSTAESSVVALFDRGGKLLPGYPVATDLLSSDRDHCLFVGSDGTAYETVVAGTVVKLSGSRIVAFGP